MLTTIIYRSHLHDHVPVKTLEDMVAKANSKNKTSTLPASYCLTVCIFSSCWKGRVTPYRVFISVFARMRATIIWWN